jgi:hypothetical protein
MPLRVNSSLPFDTTTMLMLSVAGIFVKLFLSGGSTKDGSTGPASATIWGYGLTSISFIGLLVVVISLASQDAMKLPVMKAIKEMVKASFPIMATLVILGWIIVINMTYLTRINQGKVAPEFHQFSFFSTILILLQLIVVFKFILDTIGVSLVPDTNPMLKKAEQVITSELTSVTIILSLLNLIFAGMMQVVVEFFSTDG